jgi:HlyD family secretion protein
MATNNNSKRTWMIIGGAVVLIFGGLLLAKKMEWIGKVEPTEVEFTKVSRSTIIEKVSASATPYVIARYRTLRDQTEGWQ